MKILAKISAVLISATMAVSAFGCGSSDAASQNAADSGFEPEAIEVNDPGFAITDAGKLRYAFIAVNPNDGYLAEGVVFTIEAYDASGSMIAGSGETISALYPGAETPGSGEADLFSRTTDTPEVASLSIVPMMDTATWTKTDIDNDAIEASMDIANARMSTGDDGLDIKATIQYAEGDDLKLDASKVTDFRAVAVLFDDAGNALCGTDPITLTLDSADATYDFAETIPNPPVYSECNLYVTPLA